jgi:hypothetical protein
MKSLLLLLAAATLVSVAPIQAADDNQAAELLVAAKVALGGEKVDAVKALSATGDFRRMLGEREMTGETTIELMLPDKLKRTDDMGFPGGPSFSRVVAINGSEFWEDSTNRGGGGFMARMAGGQGGANGQGLTDEDRARFRQMQQRRLEGDLRRYLLVWLMRTDAPVNYVGTAEAADGKADVLEVKPEGAQPIRLFLDQQSHLPLMLSYTGTLPRFFMQRRNSNGNGAPPSGAPPAGASPSGPPPAGGPPTSGTTPNSPGPSGPNTGPQIGGQPPAAPTPEEIRRRMAEPPQEVTFEMRLADYKKVDGVMLPHTITQSVDGKATEEWSISQYKVNPKLKPDTFVKK